LFLFLKETQSHPESKRILPQSLGYPQPTAPLTRQFRSGGLEGADQFGGKMFLSKKGGKLKGQSLTEAALIMPLIVFFLFTIIWFAKVMLTWQQIVGASRYGTDLIVYTPFSEKYIRQDIIDYLSNPSNVGRILDKDKLEVNIKIHDIKKIDYSLSVDNLEMFNPVNILNDIKELSPIKPEMSSVEIVYWYEAPFVFKAFGKDKIYIRAYSEVLNGSASAGQAQRQ
jgi:hypothetical protein